MCVLFHYISVTMLLSVLMSFKSSMGELFFLVFSLNGEFDIGMFFIDVVKQLHLIHLLGVITSFPNEDGRQPLKYSRQLSKFPAVPTKISDNLVIYTADETL